MAIIKIIDGSYPNFNDQSSLLLYIQNPDKTLGLYGGLSVSDDISDCLFQMQYVRDFYNSPGHRKLLHIVVSSPDFDHQGGTIMMNLAKDIGSFFSTGYQVYFGIHIPDSDSCRHIHYAINTTCYANGRKLEQNFALIHCFKNHVRSILNTYDVEII